MSTAANADSTPHHPHPVAGRSDCSGCDRFTLDLPSPGDEEAWAPCARGRAAGFAADVRAAAESRARHDFAGTYKQVPLMDAGDQDPKLAKKLAKAAAKAAKKQAEAGRAAQPPAAKADAPAGDRSPAERSAEAAERQVALQRWRVVLAVVGAIIALTTLLVILLRR